MLLRRGEGDNMEEKITARAAELIERRDAITAQLRDHTNTRLQLESAYQQICGAIAVLEELVPPDNVVEAASNGQVIEEEEVGEVV
jgi:hypothetical protein